MDKYVKSFDFYSDSFTFNTLGKKFYPTALGGCLTILTGLIGIAVILMFGRDFYMRQNPAVFSQQFEPEEAIQPVVTNANFTYIYNVIDNTVKPVDFETAPFTMKYYFFVMDIDTSTGATNLVGASVRELSKCSALAGLTEEAKARALPSSLCVDWDIVKEDIGMDPYISNGRDATRYTSHYIALDPCKTMNGEQKCSSYKEINDFLYKKQYLISITYPDYIFDPSNYYKPMQINYKVQFVTLSAHIQKLLAMDFQYAILEDNTGWIFDNIEEIKMFGMYNSRLDLDYFPEEVVENSRPFFYFYYLIQWTPLEVKLNRSFMTIQTLLAIVGGFMRVVYESLLFLSKNYSANQRTVAIINYLYGLEDQSNKPNFSNTKTYALSKISQFAGQTRGISGNSNLKLEQSKADELQINKLKKNPIARKKIELGVYKLLKVKLCCCGKQKLLDDLKPYFNARKVIDKKLDVTNYLVKLDLYENMMRVLLNSSQIKGISAAEKTDIFSGDKTEKEMKRLDFSPQISLRKFQKFKTYIEEKVSSGSAIAPEDYKIISLLPNGMKRDIEGIIS